MEIMHSGVCISRGTYKDLCSLQDSINESMMLIYITCFIYDFSLRNLFTYFLVDELILLLVFSS